MSSISSRPHKQARLLDGTHHPVVSTTTTETEQRDDDNDHSQTDKYDKVPSSVCSFEPLSLLSASPEQVVERLERMLHPLLEQRDAELSSSPHDLQQFGNSLIVFWGYTLSVLDTTTIRNEPNQWLRVLSLLVQIWHQWDRRKLSPTDTWPEPEQQESIYWLLVQTVNRLDSETSYKQVVSVCMESIQRITAFGGGDSCRYKAQEATGGRPTSRTVPPLCPICAATLTYHASNFSTAITAKTQVQVQQQAGSPSPSSRARVLSGAADELAPLLRTSTSFCDNKIHLKDPLQLLIQEDSSLDRKRTVCHEIYRLFYPAKPSDNDDDVGLAGALPWDDRACIQSIISAMVQVILQKPVDTRCCLHHIHDAAQKSAALIMDLMSYDFQKHPSLTCIPRSEWASIVLVLLHHAEADAMVAEVSERLYSLVCQQGQQIVTECPELLSALAGVLGSAFSTDPQLQRRILETFQHLLISVNAASVVLPRQDKVLEALTAVSAMAHDEDDGPDNDSNRWLATTLIVTLTQMVSNRRRLARQPGLLANLIRFARQDNVMDADGEGQGRLISREVLKERIVQLAQAL